MGKKSSKTKTTTTLPAWANAAGQNAANMITGTVSANQGNLNSQASQLRGFLPQLGQMTFGQQPGLGAANVPANKDRCTESTGDPTGTPGKIKQLSGTAMSAAQSGAKAGTSAISNKTIQNVRGAKGIMQSPEKPWIDMIPNA